MTGTRSSRAACALILSGLAAGFIFAFMPDRALAAGAGECVTAPKGAIAKGEHWFYRVERGTQRRCWYTRAGMSRKPVEPTPPKRTEKAPDAAPLTLSVANARAEADLSPSPPNAPLREVVPVNETNAKTWTLAERWSDRIDAIQPAPPPPTVTTIQRAVVEAEPTAITDDTLHWLIDVLSVAAALAGITVLLVAMLVRRRQRPPDEDIELLPLTDRDGKPSATWYEPPMDRLRMARHLAELPRIAT